MTMVLGPTVKKATQKSAAKKAPQQEVKASSGQQKETEVAQ